MHTHAADKPTIDIEFSNRTDWNPWLTISQHGKNITPEQIVMHLDGMDIEAGYAFAESWAEAGHLILEWASNRRSSEEGVAS